VREVSKFSWEMREILVIFFKVLADILFERHLASSRAGQFRSLLFLRGPALIFFCGAFFLLNGIYFGER